MQEALKDSADLNQWTREYPWASVGVAAALGFVTAASLTPSGHDPRKEWMEMVRQALREGYIPTEPPGTEPQGPSKASLAFSSLLKTFGGALQSSVVAALTAKAQAPDPSANGHHEE